LSVSGKSGTACGMSPPVTRASTSPGSCSRSASRTAPLETSRATGHSRNVLSLYARPTT